MWYLQIVNVCVLSLVLRVPLSPLVGADLHLSRFELPKGDVVLRSSDWALLRLVLTAPAASAVPPSHLEVLFDGFHLVNVALGVSHGFRQFADIHAGERAPRVDKALLLRLGWDKDEVLVFLLACAGSSSRCLLALDLPLKIVPLFAVLLDVRPLASLVLGKERKRGRFRLAVSTAGGGDVKETRGARIRMS